MGCMILCPVTDEPENVIKSEPDTKNDGVDLFAQDVEAVQLNTNLHPEGDSTLTQDTCLISEDGGVGGPREGPQPIRPHRKRRLRGGDPWRLRLDYLVAYGPQGRVIVCMVCSQVLHESKVSNFRRHIQECHPETTAMTRQEREAMAAAWTKDSSTDFTHIQNGETCGQCCFTVKPLKSGVYSCLLEVSVVCLKIFHSCFLKEYTVPAVCC